MPSIEALTPVLGLNPRGDRLCTHTRGLRNLSLLGERLAGTADLVGLYASETAEPGYTPDPVQAGRIVALARLLPMPTGHSPADYPSGFIDDGDGQDLDRWPFGWPSETVFCSLDGGPVLRQAVELVLGLFNFADFVTGFQHGPVDLRLMPALRQRLMDEIEREIAQRPFTRIQNF
jgi:hypothetical protein